MFRKISSLNDERKDRSIVFLSHGQGINEIYIYSMDLVFLYTVDDTWAASSLWLGEVIRDYDFNPGKRRSWRQREVEQFHFHKFPLINRSTSANRVRSVFVATVPSLYVSYIHARRVLQHSRYISVIKRGRPLFRYLGRVSRINTATRCCLNIYPARAEDSINLTNLEIWKIILLTVRYRFYSHCKISL